MMNKIQKLGALFILSSLVNAQTTQQSLAQSIEKKIRQMDLWVETYIEQDYSNDDREGHVRIVLETNEDVNERLEMGLVRNQAAYNPQEDILILPQNEDRGIDELSLESLSHELWHALSDSEKKQGLLHQEDYNGPSLEEIADYCKRKIESSDFKKIIDDLQKYLELEKMKRDFNESEAVILKYMKIVLKIRELYDETEKIIKSQQKYKEFIPKEDIDKIESDRKNFARLLNDYVNITKSDSELLEKIQKMFEKDSKISPEEFIEIGRKIKAGTEAYKEINLVETYKQHKTFVTERYDYAFIYSIEQDIKELRDKIEKEDNLKEKKYLEEELSQWENIQADFLMIKNFRNSADFSSLEDILDSTTDYFSDLTDEFVYDINKEKIVAAYTNPEEIMARVVNSLYEVYIGEVTQNLYPLSEEDLQFLERFEFNGSKLFEKGIAKYRLALEMAKSGISTEEVRRSLINATNFEFNGNNYEFPEANFDVVGEIPLKTMEAK